MAETKAKPELKFEVVKTIGVIAEGTKGWKKELNLVKWSDRDPKYDIRDWSPEHKFMGKGVTLKKEELLKLKELLQNIKL
ncbi:MAG: PC4/YdbC family ssDNA-binding protein [Endomicrobia bacterium]|nr:PC4/YdbC family ssDNA-binding protein [Endomicrobiia bacterium]